MIAQAHSLGERQGGNALHQLQLGSGRVAQQLRL